MNRIYNQPVRTILWSEITLDNAIKNLKKGSINEKQYTRLKQLHQNVYDDADKLYKEKRITLLDLIKSTSNADLLLKSFIFKT